MALINRMFQLLEECPYLYNTKFLQHDITVHDVKIRQCPLGTKKRQNRAFNTVHLAKPVGYRGFLQLHDITDTKKPVEISQRRGDANRNFDWGWLTDTDP